MPKAQLDFRRKALRELREEIRLNAPSKVLLFSTEGATLALHKSDRPNPDDPDEQLECAGRWRSGFSVPDLDEFHRRMVDSGVTCRQEPQEVFGAKIAQYLDPDGLVIAVGEESRGK